jgi:hypothetical protein
MTCCGDEGAERGVWNLARSCGERRFRVRRGRSDCRAAEGITLLVSVISDPAGSRDGALVLVVCDGPRLMSGIPERPALDAVAVRHLLRMVWSWRCAGVCNQAALARRLDLLLGADAEWLACGARYIAFQRLRLC